MPAKSLLEQTKDLFILSVIPVGDFNARLA